MANPNSLAVVKNMPLDVHDYIVARVFEGELWYWGSWDDHDEATKAAREVGGIVCFNYETYE